MKKTIGFRFSAETHERLNAIALGWDCTRTEAIERLVDGACRHDAVHDIGEAELPEISAEEKREFVEGGWSEEPLSETTAKPLTQADPAKMQAFQSRVKKK